MKPAQLTPLSTLLLGDILQEAGLPSGVISVLPGSGLAIGNTLVTSPLVAKVSFTGSSEVGSQITRLCADNITRVSLELGGKAANIVFADADIGRCIQASVYAVFGNCGQDCCARSRILVQRTVYEEFVERFARRTTALHVGQPLDEQTEVGPLISAGQRQRSLDYITLGQQEGAQLAVGGTVPDDSTAGYFLKPAILTQVNNRMRVAQEEIFGPVVCIIPFDSEEEAIRLPNDVVYGLSGSVWTSDLGRAIRVTIGGYKKSGFGREMGMHAAELYTELKSVFFSQL